MRVIKGSTKGHGTLDDTDIFRCVCEWATLTRTVRTKNKSVAVSVHLYCKYVKCNNKYWVHPIIKWEVVEGIFYKFLCWTAWIWQWQNCVFFFWRKLCATIQYWYLLPLLLLHSLVHIIVRWYIPQTGTILHYVY